MMVAIRASEMEARRQRLDELFEDQPYLSATMRASRLHEREQPIEAVPIRQQWPDLAVRRHDVVAKPRVAPATPKEPEVSVTSLGFVVNIRQDANGIRAEIQQDDSHEIMNAAEAARFMRVGLGTLRRLVSDQGLPSFKIGRSRRFRKSAVLRWMKSKEA
jgi:excisionase family DNA binding protein